MPSPPTEHFVILCMIAKEQGDNYHCGPSTPNMELLNQAFWIFRKAELFIHQSPKECSFALLGSSWLCGCQLFLFLKSTFNVELLLLWQG